MLNALPLRAGLERIPGLAWVLAIVALASLPTLGNALVWDDLALIRDADFIQHWRNLPRAFLFDTMYAADGGRFQTVATLDTYRPVSIATFFVDAALSGREPIAYHVDNLLAHLACVALVFRLGTRLLRDLSPRAPLFAAAWFGLNPVLGEAHLWINGRSDLWCTLFGLAGMLVWLAGRSALAWGQRSRLFLSASLLWTLGLLSKESLLPALLVLAAWSLSCLPDVGSFVRARSLRRAGLDALPIAAAAAIYLGLRSAVLSGLHAHAGPEQLKLALTRLPLLLLDGLRSAFLPAQHMPRYLHEAYGRLSPSVSWLAALAVAGLSYFAFRARKRWPALSLGMAWFAATLAPACLIATLAWYGFGRYLYLPLSLLSIGVSAWVADIFQTEGAQLRPALRRFCGFSALGYLALFTLKLALSTGDWDGSLAFYRAIIAEDSEASHGQGGMGKLLVETGHPVAGIPYLEKAVALAPSDSRYLNNLGIAFLRSGQLDAARRVAELGRARFPEHAKFDTLDQLVQQAEQVPSTR